MVFAYKKAPSPEGDSASSVQKQLVLTVSKKVGRKPFIEISSLASYA
tara:strand:+ start:334 stop:474 length:141 start_codon:yes stop_codon:yes gene_type:complete